MSAQTSVVKTGTYEGFDNQAPEGKRRTNPFSLFVNLILSFTGVNTQIARKHPEEIPDFVIEGLLVLGIWCLLFCMQSLAGFNMSGSWEIATTFAALSSTLICLADIAILLTLRRLDGEYFYLKDADADDPRLARLKVKRNIGLVARLAFGVAISLSVVSLSMPSYLRPEIKAAMQRQEIADNVDAWTEINEAREGRQQVWESAKEERLAVERKIRAVEEDMATLRSTQLSASSTAERHIQSLKSRLQDLLDEAEFSARCATAEALGENNPACATVMPSTKQPGCGPRCQYWKNESRALEKSAERIRREIDQARQAVDPSVAAIDSLKEELARLQSVRADAAGREQAAKQDWLASDVEFGQKRREARDYKASHDKGIVAVFETVNSILSKSSEFTLRMFLALKVFFVFLEVIVFFTRFFGGTPAYCRELHARYVERGQRAS